jgi:hypothetical protein
MFSTSIYYHEKPNQHRLISIRPFSFNNLNLLYSFIMSLSTFKESKSKSKVSNESQEWDRLIAT